MKTVIKYYNNSGCNFEQDTYNHELNLQEAYARIAYVFDINVELLINEDDKIYVGGVGTDEDCTLYINYNNTQFATIQYI